MWILQHVGLVPKNGHEDLTQTNIGNVTLSSFVTNLLHPTTEVVQGIWVDVPVGDELGEVKVLKEMWLDRCALCTNTNIICGHGLLFPLDKEDSFVLERTWPIRVDDQVACCVLGDHLEDVDG